MNSYEESEYALQTAFLVTLTQQCRMLHTFIDHCSFDIGRVDFSSLLTLDSLTTLHLPISPMTNRALDFLRQFSSLTQLDCFNDISEITPEWLEYLTREGHQLTQLRELRLHGATIESAHLIALSRLPSLTSLEPIFSFENVNRECLQELSKMNGLRYLHFAIYSVDGEYTHTAETHTDPDPALESIKRQQCQDIVMSIASLKQLTALRFNSEIESLTISSQQWMTLLSSLPLLTSLSLSFDANRFPLPHEWIHYMPHLTELSLYSPRQCPITFHKLSLGLTLPDRLSLHSLDFAVKCPDISDEKSLTDKSLILRETVFSSFPNLLKYQAQFAKIHGQQESADTIPVLPPVHDSVPESLLVGIELNPGPTTSTAAAAIAMSATMTKSTAWNRLYSDVIRIILTMLVPHDNSVTIDSSDSSSKSDSDLLSLLAATSINHVWRSTFLSCASLGCHLRANSFLHPSTLITFVQSNFSRRHLTSLDLKSYVINLCDLRLICQLPLIRHLDIVMSDQDVAGVGGETEISQMIPLMFPSTLIELKIAIRPCCNESHTLTTAIIRTIARDCPLIQIITFKESIDTRQHDFASLAAALSSIPSLRSLTLPCIYITDDVIRYFTRQISHLTHLDFLCSHDTPLISSEHIELLTTNEAPDHPLQLSSMNLSQQFLTLRHMHALSRIPSLTILEPEFFQVASDEILNYIIGMKRLKSLRLCFEQDVSKEESDVSRIIQAIHTLKLHTIQFENNTSLTRNSLLTLFSTQLHLTSLTLKSEKVAWPNEWIHHVPALIHLEIQQWSTTTFSLICEGYTFTDSSSAAPTILSPHMNLTSLVLFYQYYGCTKAEENIKRIFHETCIKSAPNVNKYRVDFSCYEYEEDLANPPRIQPIDKDVPQPSLVGIELNPGPQLYSDVIRHDLHISCIR